MLFLISPAKALDHETPPHIATHTQPLFMKQATELVAVMREKSPQQIAELMDLSDALAGLNAARYQAWRPRFTPKNAKQAVLAFDGDVYGGLDAKTLPEADLRSRAILRTMKADEARHAEHAEAAGARALPQPVPMVMAAASKLMKTVAYRL
jgi:cytoplasmic iron level regulating protein YaaA (DUF328/UPF0246 family)